jgi:hypothetical protein
MLDESNGVIKRLFELWLYLRVMLKHLYNNAGTAIFSSDVPDDTPETEVVSRLISLYQRATGRDTITGLYVHDTTISELRFGNFSFEDSTFQNVTFDRAALYSNWWLKRCRFEHCQFTLSQLHRSNIEDSDFIDVDFTQCSIMGRFTNCRLAGVKFAAGDADELGVGISGGQAHGVEFVDIDVPIVENIYSKLWAYIEDHGPGARHQLALMNNAMASVLGPEWGRFSERWNIWGAIMLILLKNSQDPEPLAFSRSVPGLIEDIKRRAKRDASVG